MVMWMSPRFAAARGVDVACMKARSNAPARHDSLFHSVLGLMPVRTPEYVRALDLFSPCERNAMAARCSAATGVRASRSERIQSRA
jgi:lipid A ethanolaminephosphotransferase